MDIGLEGADSAFILPPSINEEHLQALKKDFFYKRSHFYICSSGTSSKKVKTYEFEKETIFSHAESLNKHFSISHKSRLLMSLPSFFMGGFSIATRAYVCGAKLVETNDFSVQNIFNIAHSENITHLSLVPTQVHDFLQYNLEIPKSIQMIFIGGDKLSRESFDTLRSYPSVFYPTYGNTEMCSQVATSRLKDYNSFDILPWNTLEIENEHIVIQSPFHFKRYSIVEDQTSQIVHFKEQFRTNDIGSIDDGKLTVFSRSDRLIKNKGKFIDLDLLESELQSKNRESSFFISSIENSRRGSEPVIFYLRSKPRPISDIRTIPIEEFKYTKSFKLIKRAEIYL